jgi:hypothetical protein
MATTFGIPFHRPDWSAFLLLQQGEVMSMEQEYVRKVFLHAWKEAINKPLPRPTT